MSHQSPSLPDRLLALMRAHAEVKDEMAALYDTDNLTAVGIEIMVDTQLEAVTDALRHAHNSIVRLRLLAKHAKEKK